MNDEIRAKMAESEGWTDCGFGEVWRGGETRAPDDEPYAIEELSGIRPEEESNTRASLPTYDNDNDMDRLLRGMDDDSLMDYWSALWSVVNRNYAGFDCHRWTMLKATADQKAETIANVNGWFGGTDPCEFCGETQSWISGCACTRDVEEPTE